MGAETKHTPGPWEVRDHGARTLKVATFLTVNDVATNVTIAALVIGTSHERNHARLIAAAPEMAEALIEAAETIEWLAPAKGDCKCSGAFECVAHSGLAIVRSALSRARGETP